MKTMLRAFRIGMISTLAILAGLASPPAGSAPPDDGERRFLIQYPPGNREALKDFIEANGGTVAFDYSELIDGLAADLTPEARRAVDRKSVV